MQSTPLIDHVNLPVTSVAKSCGLYRVILAELGIGELLTEEDVIGFGRTHWEFGIVEEAGTIVPIHIAFSTASQTVVDNFHRLALEAGAVDNGPPGFRKEYGPTYYAAFVHDFDGHNVEVVRR